MRRCNSSCSDTKAIARKRRLLAYGGTVQVGIIAAQQGVAHIGTAQEDAAEGGAAQGGAAQGGAAQGGAAQVAVTQKTPRPA